MDKTIMALAFNEWMRRFTEEPERFEAEFETVGRFLNESRDGIPSYGETATQMLHSIAADLAGAPQVRS